ncbi:MAG: short chain dehydrogenase [Spirochaetae bacterium HGW-Spirochaetae-1]|jgi:hypothetical protein|nr:MAG: short chain dehydrogenase [Spirochaetae bacterium HGW-Spirochaetae-1]
MSKTILITGASSGIGQALSYILAEKGYNLALAARSIDVLEKMKGELTGKYPAIKVEVRKLDVTDYTAVPRVMNELAEVLGGLDIIYANAGIDEVGKVGTGIFEKHRKNIEVNLLGAIATVEAAVEYFKKRGQGHVMATSSIAEYRGLPNNSSYCAAKAGISIFCEAARAELHGTKIKITVLSPGFIDTPINRKMKSRPFVIDVEKGARAIARLMEKQVKRSTVPVFPWNLVRRLLRILPTGMIAKM